MEQVAVAPLPEVDTSLEKALQIFARQTSFTISSCRQPDMPIVYASPGFYELTGYSKKEVVGKNCRFLQGPGTSRQAVLELRNCVQEDRGCTVCLLNYRKDGKPFWNQLCLAPVSDQYGVAYYLGIQTNVTGVVLAYRSQQQQSPFQAPIPGPHGGVHSFEGCPDVVESELKRAAELESHVRRWHSEKMKDLSSESHSCGPVSCALLPTSFLSPLYKLHQSFVLVDPNLPDMPIQHASDGFLKLTGRPRNQVVGHNCRFMQGSGTDQAEVAKVRQAIKEKRPVTVKLLNYRHDGTPFWNNLHVAPVRNADGEVVFFVGVQLDITLAPKQPSDTEAQKQARQALSLSEGRRRENAAMLQAAPEITQRAKQGQRSVVGTVRVLCRSLSAKSGLRRSLEDQHQPHRKSVSNLPERSTTHKPAPGSERLDMPTLGSSHI